VHLAILNPALLESGFLKLPRQVIATIFKHMTETGIAIWILKMVKNAPP
jgi:hypothetical protein